MDIEGDDPAGKEAPRLFHIGKAWGLLFLRGLTLALGVAVVLAVAVWLGGGFPFLVEEVGVDL